ncbi:MAG TPA: WbuC family cupin fold metalloprotein [Nevskiaceae bacterium]|nr:WbuC family cupin fold metalloprotein [Nevskiaceae bacterium]
MKRFDAEAARALAAAATAHPRARLNLNWHDPAVDPVQRFFNHLSARTYVRPHRHEAQSRWELTLLLTGTVDLLRFDDEGTLIARERLQPDGLRAVEVPAAVWHSYAVPEDQEALLFEIKEGPYQAALDKRFAEWAPAETDWDASQCRDWMRYGVLGSRFRRRASRR